MVDVSPELIVRETDCCETRDEISGMYVKALWTAKRRSKAFRSVLQEDSPVRRSKNKDSEVLVKQIMNYSKRYARIMAEGVNAEKWAEQLIELRSCTILTCKCKVCLMRKCYQHNMATGEPVQVGSLLYYCCSSLSVSRYTADHACFPYRWCCPAAIVT